MRSTKRNLATSCGWGLCALALAFPLSAGAQGSARAESQRSQAQRSQGEMSGRTADARRVQGQVLQTRRVDLRDGGQNLLVLIGSQRGDRRLAVDLGAADAIQRNVSQGSRLEARGRVIDVRGRSVLVADQARLDGQTLRLQRTSQQAARSDQGMQQASRRSQAFEASQRQQARAQQGEANVRQLRGEVVKLKQVSVADTNAQNRLALVRSDRDDKRRIVDLGPVSGGAADVSVGDRIHVRGPVVSMKGQSIMLARDVMRDGQRQAVQRSRSQQGQQQGQQSRAQQQGRFQQSAAQQEGRAGAGASYVPRTDIQTQNGIRYVSGGVGNTSQQRMRDLARQFPLRVTLATQSGAYIGSTPLRVEDAQGNTLLSVITEGPIFLAELPPGTYEVVAKHPNGPVERQRVTLEGQGSKNLVFQIGEMQEDAG